MLKFLPLVFKNAFRNRRRTILTVLSIGMSLFLISTLRTLLQSLEAPPMTPESAKRVIVRHQTSLANVMPIAYRDKLSHVPGVDYVVASQWFGGIYKDPSNFFAQFAVDADHFFDVYGEVKTQTPEQAKDFIKERTASLAGVKLAQKYGWKVGDRVTLQGAIFPFNVETTIRGLVDGGGSDSSFYFHYDYFNELFNNQNIVGTFIVKAKSADDLPAIADAVDTMFANSTAPTKTETEQAFILGFASMWGNIKTVVISISTIVLFTIVLVSANTMAMSIRERTGEIAIMKTLGFTPSTVLSMIVGEALVISTVGGLAGSLGALVLFKVVDIPALSGGFIQQFGVSWDTVLLAAAIAMGVGFVSTLFPAWAASRVPIVEAMRRRGE